MTGQITLSAPAKVNLTLDVFGGRTDGFHDIDSVVVPFTPADVLTITVNPNELGAAPIELHCDDKNLPTGPANLAYRAAVAFVSRVKPARTSRIIIHLQKFLPYEAGLGGGSSDAATVLMGLALFFTISPATLLEIAAAIGSDVPLFLKQSPVRIAGRGEIVTKILTPMPKLHGVFVKPRVGVPTGPAYALLDALPPRSSTASADLLVLLESSPSIFQLAEALHNDFEAAVLPAFSQVAAAHVAVTAAGALRALLCGSGSAIFGLARDEPHAREIAKRLTRRFPYVSVASSHYGNEDAR